MTMVAFDVTQTARMRDARPTIWHVGGDDVHKRIPLLHALADRGFQVGAVGSEDGGRFRDSDIPYFRYKLHRKISPVSDLLSCRELSQLLKRERPDLVHGFDTKPAIAAPILARNAGIRGRVRTITGLGFVMASGSPVAQVLRPVYRFLQKQASEASFTIFQNGDDREYFLANDLVRKGSEELVLGSGVDVARMREERPSANRIAELRRKLDVGDRFVVTMISRLDENKGVGEFLDAADLVHDRLGNVVFLLVGPHAGEGKQADKLLQRIDMLPDSVRYLGPRDDVPAILSLSDVSVLPSYREGIPRSLIEAGAMEIPSVTTDVPGCRDVVRDGWNGVLVPPKNAQAVADAVCELLSDPDQRLTMGRRGLELVTETFDLSFVADAYADIYRRALAAHAS